MRGDKRPLPAPLSAELVQPEKVDAKLNASIHNRFDVEVIDSRTGEVRQRAQGENIILNQLWTRLLAPEAYFSYIHYGTGTGALVATRTSLFAYEGSNSITNIEYSKLPDNSVSVKGKIVLSDAEAVGKKLTELGIAYSASSNTLVTHAFLKDMNGNAITIEKTSTDIINIYATVFLHMSSGISNTIQFYSEISGFQKYLLGTFGSEDYRPVGPPVIMQPSVSWAYTDSYTTSTASYFPTEKKIILTMPRIPVNAFNSFGFDYMIFYSRYDIKTGYTPLAFPSFFIKLIDTWIKPTQILQEVCGTADGLISKFGTRFRIDVAKAVTVYCNGVAVASNTVEVLNYPVEYSDLGLYFVPLDNTSTVNNHVPKFANVLSSIALSSWITTSPHIYYNPNWELGVAKFKSNGFAFYCSNDLITWIHLVQKNGDNLVPEQYQHYRYWKTVGSSSSHNITGISAPNTYTGKNIVLASAPNNGAVITVTYTPAVVAKDANHVFDFSCELQFGEYTPPVV